MQQTFLKRIFHTVISSDPFFFFDQDREKHEPPAKDEPEEQEDSGSGESVEEPEDKYGWCSSLNFN